MQVTLMGCLPLTAADAQPFSFASTGRQVAAPWLSPRERVGHQGGRAATTATAGPRPPQPQPLGLGYRSASASRVGSWSIVTTSPSRTVPAKIAFASLSPISFCTSRRSGRAPYAGS